MGIGVPLDPVPSELLRVFPTTVVPVTAGVEGVEGVVPVTPEVDSDEYVDEVPIQAPVELLAVTPTRKYLPTSLLTGV